MASDMSKWDNDMTLYLFTSLTAGSSHIVTATSRIETILRANRIPFTYIDTATNDDARRLYMRRGQGKKFPLLVKEGYFLGGITEVEEWNEFGELLDEIGDVAEPETSIVTAPLKAGFASPYPLNAAGDRKSTATASSGASIASSKKDKENDETPRVSLEAAQAFGKAGSEAASIAASKKSAPSIKSNLSTHSTLPDKSNDSLDAFSPRPSVDSAMPRPLGLGGPKTPSPTGQTFASNTGPTTNRQSTMTVATNDAIKALEEALAIPEDQEIDLSSLSLQEDDSVLNEDVPAKDNAGSKEDMTKVDSISASTAVVDDKSSFVAPSTPTKDNDAREPEATPTNLAPQDDNTPRVSSDVVREKGFDAPSFNNNQEGDNVKEEEDTEKKGKETTAPTTGEQQATTTVAGDENVTAPASSSASS
ncbi:Glutaredoxin domain-containing protein [Lasiodiplodia theobromae]|uniref:Glutaredoxin domain-containing protein n=1 Tax=Lasiodiplodia theobromae TaxID=45133 RepID=UPI0015C3182C|nr:Glutaredoxin domain-containing protein [Lasiodiplodia theobromae]KAF4537102.1 Glutaredoxin domain-containing protein [Lasiodiplodia theobromae]